MSDITERLMRFTHYQRVWHQWDEDGKQNLGDAITEAVEELDRTRAKLAAAEKLLAEHHCEKCGGLLICIDDSVCSCSLATISAATFPVIADGCFTGDTLTIEIDENGKAAKAGGSR